MQAGYAMHYGAYYGAYGLFPPGENHFVGFGQLKFPILFGLRVE
jgi:hypothetical protein